MTPPVFSKVYMSGVAAMCLPYHPAKTIFRVWDHNEMNMVWHQTVGPDCNSTPATPFSHTAITKRTQICSIGGKWAVKNVKDIF